MAITVNFHNISSQLLSLSEEDSNKLTSGPPPTFETHRENIGELRKLLQPYLLYKNILIIGNGGSVWSAKNYHKALGQQAAKKVKLLTDMEPDYLNDIKKQFQPENSVVVVVSKSGSTVGAIENLFTLIDYPQIYVTDKESSLGQIAKQRDGLVVPHPAVGGRYSGFTSSAYVPAILAGLPVEEIEAGGRSGYDQYRNIESSNPALLTAFALYQLENKGYVEVFFPIYSNFLKKFGMIVTQLFHESFGKEGRGLTVVAAHAPEIQHHTNQRFFGGRKNMIGCLLHVEREEDETSQIKIPKEYQHIPLRSGRLSDIDGLTLANAFRSEYIGTLTDAKNQGIPLIDMSVSQVTGQTVGELMAFWHYVTVFSSLLRGVDPYDQPQVEISKVIYFEERLKFMD